MTTVAQMIEWLKTLPQDAEVECGVEMRGGYDSYMTYAPVDTDSCAVVDYCSEYDRMKYPKMAGKVVVYISGD
jgi:methenyltetrahydromethanopterin cyclohydrolase